MGGLELESLEVATGQEVGDAGHGVRTIDRRGALLEHFDPVQRDRRDGVDVHETATDQARGHVDLAAAVEQNQRTRGAKASQIHVRYRLGHGRGRSGCVPALPLTEHARGSAQTPEEVHRLRRPLLGEGPAASDGYRIG